MSTTANEFKEQGNKLFSMGKIKGAIPYSKAIVSTVLILSFTLSMSICQCVSV